MDIPWNLLKSFTLGIGSAVQHAVQIERLAAGQQRKHDVKSNCKNHRKEVDFLRIHGEPVRRDIPDDIGIERFGNRMEEPCHGLHPAHVLQERVNIFCPCLLADNTSDGKE